MAQKGEVKKPGIRQEFIAILGLFFALFLYLSLISEQFVDSGNWCGEVGRLIAQVLLGFTGWGAYLLPTLITLLSLLFFGPQMSYARLPQVTAGITGALISFCALASSLALYKPELIKAGGFIGETLYKLCHGVLGDSGTVLLFSLILLASLMLATHFSPYQLTRFVFRTIVLIIRSFFKGLKSVFTKLTTRPKRKKARPVQRKKGVAAEPPGPALEPEPLESNEPPLVKALAQAEQNEEAGDADSFRTTPVAKGNWQLPPLSILA
ncbi:MAG: cell division protein FtsK, partial [Desulfobulbaceae bacterium]